MRFVIRNTVNIFLLLGFIFIVFLISCTSERKFKVLSFFFDGVPDPNAKDIVAEIRGKDSLANIAIALPKLKQDKPEFYFHKPYEEEKCISCHQEGFSNRLLKPLPELCYTCHQDFNSKYKVLHGPVASGYCTACHDHHMAKLDKLLLRPGQDLCLSCHESRQIFQNSKHEKIGSENCIDCHNPHGGENLSFLNSNSCYSCHDDFTKKYTFLHGPVATGNCNVCHESHSSKAEKLLIRESQDLCFYCHNSQEVLASVSHANIKKSNCMDCHNPHGGYDRYGLKQLIQKTDLQKINYKKFNLNEDSLLQRNIISEAGFEKDSIDKSNIVNTTDLDTSKNHYVPDTLISVKTDSDLQKSIMPENNLSQDSLINSKEMFLDNLKVSDTIRIKYLDSSLKEDQVLLGNKDLKFDSISLPENENNLPINEIDELNILDLNTDKIYIAKKGDYLYKIARELFMDPEELKKLNPAIKDFVKPGDIFILPNKMEWNADIYNSFKDNKEKYNDSKKNNVIIKESDNLNHAEIAAALPDKNISSQTIYIAKEGDYIYKIAREFNVPPRVLIDLNPDCSDKVLVGSKIILPISKSIFKLKVDSIPKANVFKSDSKVKNLQFVNGFFSHILIKSKVNSAFLDTILYEKYIAKQGDYLYKIARELNVSPLVLISLNPEIKDLLFVGGKVIIPKNLQMNSQNINLLPENKTNEGK